MLAAPLADILVPQTAVAAPDGFETLARPIVSGLPFTLALSDGFEAVLVLPTGLARQWIDADPGALVSTSLDEQQVGDPSAARLDLGDRAPLRLLVRRAGVRLAALPLNAGVLRRVSDSGAADQGVALELVALQWTICAGSIRGAGDYGSRIELAWRIADRPVDRFEPPVVSRRVLQRRPPEQRIQSVLGEIVDRRILIQAKALRRRLV